MDRNNFDRQIRTFGDSASHKLSNGKVLLLNLKKGLGTEVLKNLLLSGIKEIYLLQTNEVIDKNVVANNYFLNETDIGKNLVNTLISKISYLNPYCKIEPVDNFIDEVPTVILNYDYTTVSKFNSILRSKKSNIVYSKVGFNNGIVFVDGGENHLVNKTNDEIYDPVQIIEEKDNKFYCVFHKFQEGDIIKFSNVQGENVDFLLKEWTIKVASQKYIELDDLPEEQFTFLNGTIEKVIKPTYLNFKELNNFDKENFDKINITKTNPSIETYFGGIISMEVIKLITNNYTPINQIYEWEDTSITEDFKIDTDKNILVVGCGALGCEWLKVLSLYNIKAIDVSDPDHIESTNLSRQFLFQKDDIKKSKSLTAASKINKNNKNIIVTAHEHKFTEEAMQDNLELFKNKDIIINALDNIQARKLIDRICFREQLPLFESGTMGTKGNTQSVIPFLTETYSNSSDPDQEESFPVCTIKSFPNKIEHTIHWARDKFELFTRGPTNVNQFLFTEDFSISNFSQNESNQVIKDINNFLKFKNPKNWMDCASWALDIFIEEFNHSIKQLLHCFPKDHMIGEKLFWANGKRCPTPLDVNLDNNNIFDFLNATTNLLCICCNIENNFLGKDLKEFIKTIKIPDFVPKNTRIATTDKEEKEHIETKEELLIEEKIRNKKYNPQLFEKDDDSNWHVLWITSAANCRNMNYQIPICDFNKSKGIVGKIIPAIIPTTAAVVGLVSLEMLKFMNNKNKIEDYRSYFINLSDNTNLWAEPLPAPIKTIGDFKYNSWESFDWFYDKTLEDFKKYYENKFKVNLNMIVFNSKMLYSSLMRLTKNLNVKLSQLFMEKFNINLKEQKVSITLVSTVDLPEIQVDLTK